MEENKKLFKQLSEEKIKQIKEDFFQFIYDELNVDWSIFRNINIDSQYFDVDNINNIKQYNRPLIYAMLNLVTVSNFNYFKNIYGAKIFLDEIDISGMYLFKKIHQYNATDYIDLANKIMCARINEKIYMNQQFISEKFYEIISRNL